MPHIEKQMASFFLTTKCNLRCTYCYNSRERSKLNEQSIPLEIAQAGVDYFFSTSTSRHIRFYGPGEPTQEFTLMKDIVEYAKLKAGKLLSVELQTNGCFNDDVRKWVLDNVNIIWFSFDGEPEIQNANRPCANGKPSAPILERNVRWLIEHTDGRNLMVGARVTMTDKNIMRQKEIVNYFYSLGITHIWTDPMFPSVDILPVCDDVKREVPYFDMESYIKNYIEAFRYAKQIGVFYGSFLMCNFDGKCSKHCRACTPVPHFTTDGYVSACDLVTFGENPHHMDCFVYGKWNEENRRFDFDDTKIAMLQSRSIENMKHCSDCFAREHCGGYCLGEVMNESGSLFGQKERTCEAIRLLFKELGEQQHYDYLHP